MHVIGKYVNSVLRIVFGCMLLYSAQHGVCTVCCLLWNKSAKPKFESKTIEPEMPFTTNRNWNQTESGLKFVQGLVHEAHLAAGGWFELWTEPATFFVGFAGFAW